MLRRHPVTAGALSAPLVLVGWLCVLVWPGVAFVIRAPGLTLLGPAVGVVVGTLAARAPDSQVKGALLVAVCLFTALMWSLLLAGAPAWTWLGSS